MRYTNSKTHANVGEKRMIAHEMSVNIHDVPQEARTSGSLTPGACDAHRLQNTSETQSGPDIRPLHTVSRGYLSIMGP